MMTAYCLVPWPGALASAAARAIEARRVRFMAVSFVVEVVGVVEIGVQAGRSTAVTEARRRASNSGNSKGLTM